MDPSDLYIELAKIHILFYCSLVFRLAYVSSFRSMVPRPVGLWTLSLEKLLGFYGSNQPKNKYLNGSCSKCLINDS